MAGSSTTTTADSDIDATTASLLQGQLATTVNSSVVGANYLMEATRLGHQSAIDMRSAAALQEMRTNAQSREILQTQAAMNAPRQTAPGYVPEAPKA